MDGSPSAVGSRAEAAVAQALIHSGRRVYVPLFGAHSRVDLIYEDDRGFHRVQCKSARLIGGVLSFRTCSNTGNAPKEYRGEIDAFGVYSPDLDAVFLVPIDDVPTRVCSLRLAVARNSQGKGVRWARTYLVRGMSPAAGALAP